ncbi:MAG TPA: oxidoreductase [Cytophagales bacterium]|jgi:predicted oxidoreductase|nr:oxidoreductase [Cytophagales bacterium]
MVKKVQLSSDGPELSRIVAGMWRISEVDHSVNNTVSMIEAAVANGITTFDNADIYGDYSAEEVFGEAFEKSGVARDQVQFVAKYNIILPSSNRPSNELHMYNTSFEHIVKSVENSLKLHRTDYLDLALIHRPDPLMVPQEVVKAMEELKNDGKVKYFGVSNFSVRQFEMLQSFIPFQLVTNQIEISPFALDSFTNGDLDYCIEHNRKPMAWSPLGGGKLFQSGDSEFFRVLNLLCDRYDCTQDQLVFAWLIKHPASILPITGTTKADRIVAAARAVGIQLTREDWFRFYVAARGEDVP